MLTLAAFDLTAIEVLATAVGTLIVTWGTVALWRAARQSKHEHEIEQAINAQIANHLHQFLDLSEKSRILAERTESIQQEANELQHSVKEDQGQLAADREELASLQAELKSLRDRWGELVPTMEAIDESPELLRISADQKLASARAAQDSHDRETSIREANAYLRRLLQHPDAESRDLELAGDLAREQLRMPALARQLYERACQADTSNVSAQAELAALRIRQPAERGEALEELLELITKHPEAKNARFSLFNHFMDSDRYDDLADTCQQLVKSDPNDVTAWRNLGVALAHQNGNSQEARTAYETALHLARKEGESGDLGNTARAFARFLREDGSPESVTLARELLEEAIQEDPSDSRMLSAMGDVLRAENKPRQAIQYYEVAERLGSPVEALYARQRSQDISLLSELGLLSLDEQERAAAS